jgi:replicative DNA helicase
MESKILSSIIQDRESFNKLSKLNIKDSFSEPAKFIYDIVCDFYDKDTSISFVDLELVEKRIARELPKQIDLYRNILKTLNQTTSSPNLLEEVIALKKDAIARELSSILLAQNKNGALELMEEYKYVEEYVKSQEDDDESLLISTKVSDVVETLKNKNRINLWPKALQQATGGAMRGHNVLVFGRPEVGKSLFIINMVGGLLHDGYKVLFIENEDPAKATMSRLICRLAEKPIVDVIDNPDEVENVVKQRGYDNLILKSLSPGTFRDIQSLIDQHGVDVVVINQLRNIWVGKEGRVEQMEIAATSARNLAKKNNILVIGVTQAGDSGTNKLRLEMGDIDFSNTGMPAQMDLIVGVGSNEEYDSKSWRMISLPKNKLSGEHVFFPVMVDTKTSKVTSI